MIGFKKQAYSEEEIDKALEQPCYFCGSDSKFVFWLSEINKTTCIECVDSDEVEQFYEMKGRK
jgi:hypothetical protein